MVDQVAYTMGYTNAIQAFASQTQKECYELAASAPKVNMWGKTGAPADQAAAAGAAGDGAAPKVGLKDMAMALLPQGIEMYTKWQEKKKEEAAETKKEADKKAEEKKTEEKEKEKEALADAKQKAQWTHEERIAEINAGAKAKEEDKKEAKT